MPAAAAAELQNALLMRALRREATPRRPVWLMRQAGRYLPEYRQTREKAGSFLALAKTPELACEVTLQPLRRFALDAAIIFSDILTVADALQLGLHFVDGEGPRLSAPLQNEAAFARLPKRADSLQYVFDACALTRREMPAQTPLIGFVGAPFTLACYMIDGRGGAFWQTRRMLRERPDLLHTALAAAANTAAELLLGQILAGCNVGMVFDSWGGLLADDEYEEFSLQYIRQIVRRVKAGAAGAPVIVFGRQCALSLPAIASCGCDAAGVDWQTALPTAQKLSGGKVALQGNLDPAALLADEATARAATEKTLRSFGDAPGHIFNLGHGVDKNTPPQNVAALVEAVHNHALPGK